MSEPTAPNLPLDPAGKPARKILIAIPCGSGNPGYTTQVFCLNAAREAAAQGWETVLMVRSRDSILLRARDVLVSSFWYSDCTDMLFVDDDIAADPGVFTRIMKHDVEMVAGVYPARGDIQQYVCVPLDDGIEVHYPAGLAEVRGVGTGFLRITRPAVERLLKSMPENHWYSDDFTAKGLKIWHFFDFVFDPTLPPTLRLRSEDYAFCDRFRAAGGKVHVDVDLTLHHTGEKTWTGNFRQFLESGGGGQVRAEPGPALSLADAVEKMVAAA